MSTLSISDLNPTGSDLFNEKESYLDSITEDDLIYAGKGVIGILSTKACLIEDPYFPTPFRPSGIIQ
jgi:hypothetical protein